MDNPHWSRVTDPWSGVARGWLFARDIDAALLDLESDGRFKTDARSDQRAIFCLQAQRKGTSPEQLSFLGCTTAVPTGLGYTIDMPSPIPNVEVDTDKLGREAGDAAWRELQPKLAAQVQEWLALAHREAPRLAQESFDQIRPSAETELDKYTGRMLAGVAVLCGTIIGGLAYLTLARKTP